MPLKESHACAQMAKVMYSFLPGSGSSAWTGHVTFKTVAEEAGVGNLWRRGSKEPAIAGLLERTLEYRRDRFERLILGIVKEGIKYREKSGDPVSEEEIKKLNGLILEVGFKFPELWNPDFLGALRSDSSARAAELVEREIASENLRASAVSAAKKKLDELRGRFYLLAQQSDRQAAGHAFERLLNELFELEEVDPREPFRVVGEQIDGSFELDSEIYLVEAKWEAEPLSEAPLMVFREKVLAKSSITRGLFIALNGCTSVALDAITRGKQPNFFLMDGYDLVSVLEGRLGLKDLLRAKIRKLAEEGNIAYSARGLIQS